MKIDNQEIIIEKLTKADGGGYLAYFKDKKTIMSDGETTDEALKNLKLAYEDYLKSLKIPNKCN